MLYGKKVIDRLDEAVVIKVGEADAFPVIQGILGPYVDAGLMLRISMNSMSLWAGHVKAFMLVLGK